MKDSYEKMVQHLAQMAMDPAWTAEIKRFAQELEDGQSGFYTGIIQSVRTRIELLKKAKKNGN